ncbi:methyltransferase [Nocardia sp. NBC_00508]|uniref:methyltransferase n=1 Tax=Nocardia sp. NBC_00508 TaxID=2975992 RepID=UPI002E81FD47|nr:methyltransferase [Nocardia sp. NBC_00508]WUD66249.1 methyltransferase [Nocardia sp. NBC_00508]
MTNTDVRAAGIVDRDLIARLAFGSMAAQTLRAAVRLRVVELIGDRQRQAADVAEDAAAAPQPMTRLLRALAGLGLLREHTPGSFSVTPAGALLDPHHPDSLTSFVRMFTEPAVLRAWEHLDGSVRTGDIAFDNLFGTDFFTHLSQHPDLSAEFNAAMSQAVSETAAALPSAFDFGRFTTVTDVGGGDGTLLAGVLDAHPGLTGFVYDTAEGLARTPKTLERHGLTERCSLIAGDFFRSVPAGSDLYLMKSVLHDWTDEQAVTILRHCREVLAPGGRVLIVEPVLPEVVDTNADAHAADDGITYLSDLNMLVNVGGRERTRKDFEDVCHRAGLSLISITPLTGAAPFSLIEAVADRPTDRGAHSAERDDHSSPKDRSRRFPPEPRTVAAAIGFPPL